MINFDAFDQARRHYNEMDFPFLNKQREKMLGTRPYAGLKILHNIPLTMTAVVKIESLLLGGADVTMSCVTVVRPQKEAIDILKAANVQIQIEHNFSAQYDFCMDCCGELISVVHPKIGAVELTQTGSMKYREIATDYPVISVDDSKLKILETFFGTGESFVRAIAAYIQSDFNNKQFVIFGYGKVGRGIAYSLSKVSEKIHIVDVDINKLDKAREDGYAIIDGKNIADVKKLIASMDVVVTATGVPCVLSNFYHLKKNEFGSAILANMGAEDEYGRNFLLKDVLFEKQPLNFTLDEPTAMKYLDPIFYAHNLAFDLILTNHFKKGYNKFPDEIAQSILGQWLSLHGQELLLTKRDVFCCQLSELIEE
jgi:adenosylhomocysteinase